MPRAPRLAPRLPKGLRYVARYGGTRGPVTHIVSDVRPDFTVCGLSLVIVANGKPFRVVDVGGGGKWGQPSADVGRGHHMCKNCDRMKDADSMRPGAAS